MKKKSYIMAILATSVLTACSSSGNDNTLRPLTAETSQVYSILEKTPSDGFLFGHQDATVYGIGWENKEGESDVKRVCGDYPAVVGFDLGELEVGNLSNLDKVSFDKMKQEIINQYSRGGVVTLSWHARNPLTGGDAWDVKDTTVVKSILPGGKNHQKFITVLDKVADFINSLVTAEGVKVPVIFRPWHEHTGSWFWWGKDLCSVDDYKQLWRMTYDRFIEKGVDNVLYAYSPGGGCSSEEYMERYPGDDFVDLLGFDYYQLGTDVEAYREVMNKTLTYLTKLGREHGKPIAVTETGYEAVPDSIWWTQTLLPIIEKYPVSYVLVWRNAREKVNHYYAPYPGQVSADDFMKFYANERTLFLNDINKK